MLAFPFSFQIAGHTFLLHTVAEFVGIFVGFRFFLFLRKKKGDAIQQSNRIYIIIAALFGAVLGSRLVGGLEDISQLKMADNVWLYFFYNKSIAGGLLGGLFAVELVKYFLKEKNKSGDLFVFPLLLAMLIGRIGCFSMGVYEETYGIETTSIFGMNLGDGVLRHPVMLYELLFLLVLWIFLFWLKSKWTLKSGMLFQYYMISYLVFRFFVEMLKPNQLYFLHLGTIQIACLLGLVYYILLNGNRLRVEG